MRSRVMARQTAVVRNSAVPVPVLELTTTCGGGGGLSGGGKTFNWVTLGVPIRMDSPWEARKSARPSPPRHTQAFLTTNGGPDSAGKAKAGPTHSPPRGALVKMTGGAGYRGWGKVAGWSPASRGADKPPPPALRLTKSLDTHTGLNTRHGHMVVRVTREGVWPPRWLSGTGEEGGGGVREGSVRRLVGIARGGGMHAPYPGDGGWREGESAPHRSLIHTVGAGSEHWDHHCGGGVWVPRAMARA